MRLGEGPRGARAKFGVPDSVRRWHPRPYLQPRYRQSLHNILIFIDFGTIMQITPGFEGFWYAWKIISSPTPNTSLKGSVGIHDFREPKVIQYRHRWRRLV